ncbi:protein kinase domain-containing protein [Nocardia puris]|uniref:non-specific serine/threonine protein kinase n=1 Tax=Nocardia puris TaxID=208602 RepID=A0A366E3R9_9NOCA|nr:peptidylprolyl isomerase [Nocardia puris]RBO96164.1 serine/threonine-protein kinase [Nocardia puris]
MVRPGGVFAGFQVERVLGQGGMGVVYLARHPRLPRLVALKVLAAGMGADSEERARFEREGEVVARLDHPNIVAVYDRGVEDDRLWIAMRYVDGVDLSQIPPLSLTPQQSVLVVTETARALDYAHAVGVLHRDVKPGNILMARPEPGHGERILLTDFGIARLRDDTKNLTRTGTFHATLTYASPEQLSALPLDAKSDQYSLACTLYTLLTGAPPFDADSATAVIAGHLHHQPPPLSSRRPDLPPALDAVLARALAKEPGDRFTTCAEFADAARDALAGAPQVGHAPPTALGYFPAGAASGFGGPVSGSAAAGSESVPAQDTPLSLGKGPGAESTSTPPEFQRSGPDWGFSGAPPTVSGGRAADSGAPHYDSHDSHPESADSRPESAGAHPGRLGSQPGLPSAQPDSPGRHPRLPGSQPGFPGPQSGFPGAPGADWNAYGQPVSPPNSSPAKRNSTVTALTVGAAAIVLIAVVAAVAYTVSRSSDPGTPAAGTTSTPTTANANPVSGDEPRPGTPKSGAVECSYPASNSPAAKPVRPPESRYTAGPTVTADLNTSQGPLRLTLASAQSPCTVNNFVSLVEQGYYDDTSCHRITTNENLRVLQCGDPSGIGTGGPGYSFDDEYPIDEYAGDTSAMVTYARGTVAMANAGPGTNGSQFFLVWGDSALPPSYTIFGTLSDESLSTLDKIAAVGTDGTNGPDDGRPVTPVIIEQATVS